jgi:hypothetical protein
MITQLIRGLTAIVIIATVGVLPARMVHALRAGPPTPPKLPACNCYRDYNCTGETNWCDILDVNCALGKKNHCTCNGKNDGLCKIWTPTPTPNPFTPQAPAPVIESIDLFFRAYLVPIDQGEGRADGGLLAAAYSIILTSNLSTTDLHRVVAEALDAVIGFDLVFPAWHVPYADPGQGMGPLVVGNIRGTPPGSAEIVRAAREAMLQAIETRNLNVIEPLLADFWSNHPDYHPMHTGRLYPHGHEGDESLVPLEAQVQTLRRLVQQVILDDGGPLCGNDLREGGEECDASEDGACGAFTCRADCTCDDLIPD